MPTKIKRVDADDLGFGFAEADEEEEPKAAEKSLNLSQNDLDLNDYGSEGFDDEQQ